jgi:urate oxidase
MAHLGENRYGKSRVRVMKVIRHETHHEMKEWSVRVLLHGDFETCFTEGDNSKILPTDTMKNTVYWLARESSASTLEEFAVELVQYLVANNPQVSKATAEVEEKSWKQVIIDGQPHATTYSLNGPELQTTEVLLERGGQPQVNPEATSFAATRTTALTTLLKIFAEHDSLSVQHTLYDMGDAMLHALPDISQVKLTMPNLHCLLVDLSRFGQDNPNQIFVPIDEPHGYIEAVITR